MQTDTQVCLKLLKEAGGSGIHSFDLNKLIGTTRAAARIQDLKDEGHSIRTIYEKKGGSSGVRYFLEEANQEHKETPAFHIPHEYHKPFNLEEAQHALEELRNQWRNATSEIDKKLLEKRGKLLKIAIERHKPTT